MVAQRQEVLPPRLAQPQAGEEIGSDLGHDVDHDLLITRSHGWRALYDPSVGFLRASENWRLYLTVALLTAAFSLVIGVLFIVGKGTLLPAIFGG